MHLLPDHLARLATRRPDALAIDAPPTPGGLDRRTRSYSELTARACAIASAVSPMTGREEVVALLLPRGAIELYEAQIGVWFAAAAWIVLDGDHPTERLRELVQDVAARCVLVDPSTRARALEIGFDPAAVVDVTTCPEGGSLEELQAQRPLAANDLAYLITTSGTTGKPKAVLLQHGGLANLIHSDLATFELDAHTRSAQGSSPTFDSFLEETWIGLGSGGTVVVLDPDTARSGPDLVRWLRDERITVFCPPPTLLRAMDVRDPRRELPDLALLYVGGEAMPQDLVELWAPGRRLENGYGPTECTVVVTRGTLLPGEPVHIGRPVDGHRVHVLDEALEPLPDGEVGELCFAGPGLARGYLHRPEETARAFVEHPQLGRIYRSGDLGRVEPDGRLTCLGRRDAQLKIRGHRVEAGEIEATLAAHPGVRTAAVDVREVRARQLVAWFVPHDASTVPTAELLRDTLAATLPEYMIPARFIAVDKLPVTSGGKLDRRSLALPDTPADAPVTTTDDGSIAAAVGVAWTQVLGVQAPEADDDFFLDLGGDSLSAALVVSRLREDERTIHATVRALYETRTLGAFAAQLEASRPEAPAPDATGGSDHVQPVSSRLPFMAGQALWLSLALVVGSWIAAWFASDLAPLVLEPAGLVGTLLVVPALSVLLALAWTPIGLLLIRLSRRILLGRTRARVEPAWGSFHLRLWLFRSIAASVPWGLLSGTVLHGAALRALGGRIGRRVHIHRSVAIDLASVELLTIGDDATLEQGASLRTLDLLEQEIRLAPVEVGARARVGIRAGLQGGATLAEDCDLAPLSALGPDLEVSPGQIVDGIPARMEGARTPDALVPPDPGQPLTSAGTFLLVRLLLPTFLALPGIAMTLLAAEAHGIAAAEVIAWLEAPAFTGSLLLVFLGLTIASILAALVLEALLVRLLGPKPHVSQPRWSPAYARHWFTAGLVDSANDWLSGSLFWPPWLRLAGMRIGKGTEISTLVDLQPKAVSFGPGCFSADGIYLGAARIDRGRVSLPATQVDGGTFFGNHAVVPAGTHVPGDVLVGICTVADQEQLRRGSSWFGHPPMELPRREVVTMDRALTHDPGVLRRVMRLSWEAARFLLPTLPLVSGLVWFDVALGAGSTFLDPVLASILSAGILLLATLALKWLLLGRVKPGQHALWSSWCCRWDFLYVAWGQWARPVLSAFEQTVWLPIFLRAMGCRIGRRVLLGRGFAQVVDPDMLHLEDHATVNGLFQAHSFEDRVLKTDHVFVRAHATTAENSVLLYGADVGTRAVVGHHGVGMKHEQLLPHRRHEGCPSSPIAPQ